MKRGLYICVLAAIALCGCQTKELDNHIVYGVPTLIATIEDELSDGSKTSLDEYGNVLWKKGDQIGAFLGSTINQQYQVTDDSDGKTSAELYQVVTSGLVAGGEINNNVAFYPYQSTADIARNESAYVISDITLPATQIYAANSFGNGAFPMVAVTGSATDMNLKFKNVLGGLKLQLTGTASIASVSVTGNNNEILCGAATVTASNGSIPSVNLTDASEKTVTLNCGSVTLNETTATSFIIALPPMTMTSGFTIVVTDTEGKEMEITTTKSQTIERSRILKMPAVAYEKDTHYTTLAKIRAAISDNEQSVVLGNYKVKVEVISNIALNNVASNRVYVQDNTGGLCLYCTSAPDYEFGDVLVLDVSGETLKRYNGFLEIDGLSVSKIQKSGNRVDVIPVLISSADFLANKYEGRYVAIEDVQIIEEDLEKTWVVSNTGTSIGAECKNGDTFVIYTPKYAYYRYETVPQGSGTIMGVSTRYNETVELFFAKDTDWCNLTGTRFGEYQLSIAGNGTKTGIVDNSIVWSSGDNVLLSDGSNSETCSIAEKYDNSVDASVGPKSKFSGTVHCVFPAESTSADGNIFSVTIPYDQGTDGLGKMVLYGKSATNIIEMSPITATLKLSLTSEIENLSHILVTSEGAPIAGEISIDGSSDAITTKTTSYCIKVSENGNNDYYFSILPGTFTKMDFDFVLTDGKSARKTKSSETTMASGYIMNLKVDPTNLSF